MSWDQHHQRMDVTSAVLGEISRRHEPVIPAGRQPQISAIFGDEGSFLQALHYSWFNALTARLDAVLESGEPGISAVAKRVWDQLAAERQTIGAVLTADSAHPALVAAVEREQQRLGWAGLNLGELSRHPTTRHRPRPAA